MGGTPWEQHPSTWGQWDPGAFLAHFPSVPSSLLFRSVVKVRKTLRILGDLAFLCNQAGGGGGSRIQTSCCSRLPCVPTPSLPFWQPYPMACSCDPLSGCAVTQESLCCRQSVVFVCCGKHWQLPVSEAPCTSGHFRRELGGRHPLS